MHHFYEFFAGGGMARAGLGDGWRCLAANDFNPTKARCYRENWGGEELRLADIGSLTAADLPGRADLAWASFPCQDLSLAGGGKGLAGERSGTFWPFWRLMQALSAQDRAPRMIALENVCGLLTSHGGADFAAVGQAFASLGYRFGAIVVDAALFVPQSRPRLFIVGVHGDEAIPAALTGDAAVAPWRSPALLKAHAALGPQAQARWVWWRPEAPALRNTRLSDLLEDDPDSAPWRSDADTARLLALMSPGNLAKVEAAKQAGGRRVGCLYRRTRPDGHGRKVQRAEVRFDDLSGCLRTPAGGSSRQTLLIVEGDTVRSRLLSSREAARLMGLPDDYRLPSTCGEAYHLTGDGVVVPAVRHLARRLFEPILRPAGERRARAA